MKFQRVLPMPSVENFVKYVDLETLILSTLNPQVKYIEIS